MRAFDAENRLQHFTYPAFLMLSCLMAAYAILRLPGYLTDAEFLGSLIFLQIMAAVLWRFEVRFFPFMMLTFLVAGTNVPGLRGPAGSARWAILAAGACGGLLLYLRKKPFRLRGFHLVAAFAALAALASAMVSAFAGASALKAVSLLLLFLYGSFGARLAVAGHEETFFNQLLLSGELLVYASIILYFGLHVEWFGNPNSLGAVMGVFAIPLLQWGALRTTERGPRLRLSFALALAWVLLLASYARAGILAAILASIFLCVGLRRYRFLLQLSAFVILCGLLVSTLFPRYSESSSSLAAFVYKGRENHDFMESRKSPWEETMQSVEAHPWLGTGFGTSDTGETASGEKAAPGTKTTVGAREHGNSYLEIIEWVGVLGIVPFAVILITLIVSVARVLRRMRSGHLSASPAALLAACVGAGLLHAFFEDWLFAPGSYLCVFLWTMAFLLQDSVTTSAKKAETYSLVK